MPFSIIKADLECSITASYDKAGTEPIPNGGVAAFSGGDASIWLHYTVKNTGLKKAINFQVSMVAASYSRLIHNKSETLSLGGLAHTKTFSIEINRLSHITNQIDAYVIADTLDTVPEKSEVNNFSSYKCTVIIVT